MFTQIHCFAYFYREEMSSNGYFQNHGSILHIDGDQSFMEACKKIMKNPGAKLMHII